MVEVVEITAVNRLANGTYCVELMLDNQFEAAISLSIENDDGIERVVDGGEYESVFGTDLRFAKAIFRPIMKHHRGKVIGFPIVVFPVHSGIGEIGTEP